LRTVYFLLIVLVAIGWFAAEVEVTAPSSPVAGKWRRTANGWEVSTQWYPPQTAARPPIHPIVVGSFQLLLSAWAVLIAQPRLSRQFAAKRESQATENQEIRPSFT
jgi:hypothetical protein